MARKTNPGNGAIEALIRCGLSPAKADSILILLWREGFKVVPLNKQDAKQ